MIIAKGRCKACYKRLGKGDWTEYCNRNCSQNFRKRSPKKILSCLWCKKPFLVGGSKRIGSRRVKYCSEVCEARDGRQRNKERNRERYLRKYKENPAPTLAYRKAYRARDPEKWRRIYVIKENRRRAKLKGLRHYSYTGDEFDALCLKQRNRCYWCGESCKLSIDHILPVSRNGNHIFWNIVGACRSCNCKKRNRIWPLSAGALWDGHLLAKKEN